MVDSRLKLASRKNNKTVIPDSSCPSTAGYRWIIASKGTRHEQNPVHTDLITSEISVFKIPRKPVTT